MHVYSKGSPIVGVSGLIPWTVCIRQVHPYDLVSTELVYIHEIRMQLIYGVHIRCMKHSHQNCYVLQRKGFPQKLRIYSSLPESPGYQLSPNNICDFFREDVNQFLLTWHQELNSN